MSTCAHRTPRIVLLLVVSLLGGLLVGAAPVAGPAGAQGAPTVDPGCPASFQGLTPTDTRERYGLSPLIEAGHRGEGIRVAQLQWGAAVDRDALDLFSSCVGNPPLHLVSHTVGTDVAYPPSGEAMADAEMVAGISPMVAGLYVFTGPAQSSPLDASILDPMLLAALDPANTDGHLVDVISISYNTCEQDYGDISSTEAILASAAAAGVWVLKGAGDSGSSGCAPHGTCETGGAYTGQAVGYPSSSTHVIALGGVELIGPDPITSPQVVWNWASQCAGTGGGPSQDVPAPPWQASVPGGITDTMRMVPDVASLAGQPGYATYLPDSGGVFQWGAVDGDSLTGPVWAGALALVRSALAARGASVEGPLLPQLYAIAAEAWDPVARQYRGVFHDVVPVAGYPADNDVRGVGCCATLVGYDMTTGLGSVDFAELTDALALRSLVPSPAPVAPPVPVAAPAFTG